MEKNYTLWKNEKNVEKLKMKECKQHLSTIKFKHKYHKYRVFNSFPHMWKTNIFESLFHVEKRVDQYERIMWKSAWLCTKKE